MGKLWLNNEIVDRLAMLQQTEVGHPGVNQVAIEKDWWVTVTLKALFQTDCRDSLIFKGGTSLSKGFNIIERFSEDIDLAINHSFFGIEGTSKSQREKLRKKARAYIHETLSSQLDARLKEMGVSGYSIENVSQEQDKNGEWRLIDSDKDPSVILLHYPSILEDSINYIPPRVKIEISCLSMDEPTEIRRISSLIGDGFDGEDADADGNYMGDNGKVYPILLLKSLKHTCIQPCNTSLQESDARGQVRLQTAYYRYPEMDIANCRCSAGSSIVGIPPGSLSAKPVPIHNLKFLSVSVQDCVSNPVA